MASRSSLEIGSIETESVFPLKSRNYKVSATVGVSTVVAHPVSAILDTGAGPNLVRAEILPEDWERYRLAEKPTFNTVGASGRRLRQEGVIMLHVEIGGLRTRTRFIVVPGLAAECILGRQFIDRHVKSILPRENKAMLVDGGAACILQDSEPPHHPKGKAGPRPTDPSTKVRVAKWTTLPPRAECLVWVQ